MNLGGTNGDERQEEPEGRSKCDQHTHMYECAHAGMHICNSQKIKRTQIERTDYSKLFNTLHKKGMIHLCVHTFPHK